MKLTIIDKLRNMAQQQMQTFNIMGQILNRPLDQSTLLDLGVTLDSEARRMVEAVAGGTTLRIRTLKDVARLTNAINGDMSTDLYFTRLLQAPPVYGQMPPNRTRVYKLEMIRLWLMTHPELNEGCLDMDALVKQYRFQFLIYDWCKLMIALGEQEYITLHAEASVHTGLIQVNQLECPSEDVMCTFAPHDRDNRVSFDTDLIFQEYFDRMFHLISDDAADDLDLGGYYEAFLHSDKPVVDGRRLILHYGVKNNVGQYYSEHYHIWTNGEKRTLMRVEAPESLYPQRQNVSTAAFIPWLVATFALEHPEETNYLVQYDQESRNVAIIPGDPYVEPDPLA